MRPDGARTWPGSPARSSSSTTRRTTTRRRSRAQAGATVVDEPRRGYGSAYLAGLAAARGRLRRHGDADGTYPLDRIGEFVERLRGGADMVLGSRFKGTIEPGAMPWPNRYIGNPLLTGHAEPPLPQRRLGRALRPSRDSPRRRSRSCKLSATGMEFASEMVIKAGKRRLRIEEMPIGYRVRIGESKLSRFSDAWRHIRFMLVYSPAFLFVLPGGIGRGRRPRRADRPRVDAGTERQLDRRLGRLRDADDSRARRDPARAVRAHVRGDLSRRARRSARARMAALSARARARARRASRSSSARRSRSSPSSTASRTRGSGSSASPSSRSPSRARSAAFFLSILGLSEHAILRRRRS